MFGLLKKNEKKNLNSVKVDMHAHWLPGIDDGAQNMDESIYLIQSLKDLGYQKLIATPHIMSHAYPNTAEIILQKLEEVREVIKSKHIQIDLQAAAEYYLDEWLLDQLQQEKPLLSFGKQKYILFETGFMSKPPFFEEAVFLMKSQGYQPVFAHPERYVYLWDDFAFLKGLQEQGVLLQVNLSSLTGYYSKNAQKAAEQLIKNEIVSFVGTDSHHPKHIQAIRSLNRQKYFQRVLSFDLHNHSL